MYYLYFIRAEWTIFLDQGQIKKQHLKSTFSPCSWTLSKSLKRLLKLYETLPLETFWRIWSHVPYICLYTYALTYTSVAAAAKSLQLCPTLCDPIDGSPLGTSVPGILQARTLEWIAISFSNAWKWKVKVKSLSCAWLLATPWTAAYQALPSMGFSRQEYWSRVPLSSPTYTSTYIKMLKVPQVIASISSYLWIAGEKPNI